MKDLLKVNNLILEKQQIKETYELKEKDKVIQNLVDENIKFKEEIIKLKSICNILESDHKCVQEIAKQPKNINNNNKTVNLINSLNLSDTEQIKNLIDNNYNLDYIFSGQKGLAHFALDNILKDDKGNLKYICTDPSRQIFKYKDTYGDIQKDVEAKKLTNFLVEGGITNKACDIAKQWWTDENGHTNSGKFEILSDKTESMIKLEDDNTVFKKELASITTI